MKRRPFLIAGAIVVILIAVGLGVGGLVLAGQMGDGPEQPVNYPHAIHVTGLGLDCQFCHRGVATTAEATVPPVEQCLFCHTVVKAPNSPVPSIEVAKLINAYKNNEPIDWKRVHRQPDTVGFEHWPHIAKGFTCTSCHFDINDPPATAVKQVRSLGMGDCVNCHRDNNAPVDCATCHK